VHRWDLVTGKEIGPALKHRAMVFDVALSPDGRTLAVATLGVSRAGTFGAGGGAVRYWDVATGTPLDRPVPAQLDVTAIALRADGRAIATGSAHQIARVWDLATGQPLSSPLLHQAWVKSVAFGPGGRTIVTGSYDGVGNNREVRVWEL